MDNPDALTCHSGDGKCGVEGRMFKKGHLHLTRPNADTKVDMKDSKAINNVVPKELSVLDGIEAEVVPDIQLDSIDCAM